MPNETFRLIAHLDMDAFYASVELLRYPELAGRPVVIGGGRRHQPTTVPDSGDGRPVRAFATLRDYAGRGVITTATYEARALGLHSAMGLMKAAPLAPDAVLLPADFDAYRKYSRLFKDAVRAIAPRIQDNGIDEIYIDLTDVPPAGSALAAQPAERDAWERARDTAQSIKDAVRAATGLSCSIGVAPNKLVAKIASELDKPDGLTLVRAEDIERLVWPLPVRKINGIGPKSGARLEALGIHTIADLAAADLAWLIEHFGRAHGAFMHDAAHGRDERDVVTASQPKSVSRETTFERDLSATRDRGELSRIFTALCAGLSDDLKRKGYRGRTIGLKLRYDNFKTLTRECTLDFPTDDAHAIRRAAGECLKRVPLDRRIRLLGVRAGALSAAAAPGSAPQAVDADATRSLFDDGATR
jgi:DNA polymerase-4